MSKRTLTAKQKRTRERTRNYAPLSRTSVEKLVKTELANEVKEQAALIVRPRGRPKGQTAFQRVQQAREMMQRATPLAMKLLTKAAKIAADKGDSRPTEFLLKHVAVEGEKGKLVRPIHTSVDKLEGEGGPRMPTINIGWISAPTDRPALPVIETRALPPHEN